MPARFLLLLILPFVLAACAPAAAPSTSQPRALPSVAVQGPSVLRPAVTATYVAIGASDTFGYGVPDPATQGWVPQFAATLPAGTRLVNLGVPGLLLHRALWVDLPVAVDARPSLVTIWLAVNDLLAGVPLAQYRADLRALLGVLHTRSRARILIGNVPDLALVPAATGHLGASPEATIAAWNAAIAAEARHADVTVVDLYGGWRELAAHPDYVGSDGLHPSVAGYRRIAALFAAART